MRQMLLQTYYFICISRILVMLFCYLYPLIFHVHEKWFMDEMTRERFRIISVTKDECLFIQALRLKREI